MDAQTAAREMMALSGIEGLRAMMAGKFPPPSISTTMGFWLSEVSEGYALFEGEPSDRILNPMGIVHGGFALTLIDSCCGCAGHSCSRPAWATARSKRK